MPKENVRDSSSSPLFDSTHLVGDGRTQKSKDIIIKVSVLHALGNSKRGRLRRRCRCHCRCRCRDGWIMNKVEILPLGGTWTRISFTRHDEYQRPHHRHVRIANNRVVCCLLHLPNGASDSFGNRRAASRRRLSSRIDDSSLYTFYVCGLMLVAWLLG